jgi:uncharacterized membrane protein YeaQ/YmgE (transglycosylase-associated protein family)
MVYIQLHHKTIVTAVRTHISNSVPQILQRSIVVLIDLCYYQQNSGQNTFRTKGVNLMSLVGFLILLVIAAICGALGQAIAGYSLGGFLVSIVVGFVGAWLGAWLAGQLSLPELFMITVDGQPFPILWAVIGSALLALLVGLLTRPAVRV